MRNQKLKNNLNKKLKINNRQRRTRKLKMKPMNKMLKTPPNYKKAATSINPKRSLNMPRENSLQQK